MAKKHRLIFLITIAAGLTLFYFGIDAWMKQRTNQQELLPPVVLQRPVPEKGKEEVREKKPEEQRTVEKEEKKVEKKEEKKEAKVRESKVALKEAGEKKAPRQAKEKEAGKKEVKKAQKETRKEVKKVKKLRTYKFQVGAFRVKENAYRMLKKARQLGFKAELKKRGQLYRVYVYTSAENYRKALRTVRKYFKDALPVRG